MICAEEEYSAEADGAGLRGSSVLLGQPGVSQVFVFLYPLRTVFYQTRVSLLRYLGVAR